MKKRLDCIVCGQIVADVIGRPIDALRPKHNSAHTPLNQIRLCTGGFACNVSLGLRKLGISAGVIGRVGNDEWKSALCATLADASVDVSGVIEDKAEQTPATIVCVDSTGERTFYHTIGAHRNFCARDILRHREAIRAARVFALGYYGFIPSLEKDLPGLLETIRKDSHIRVVVDTNGAVRPTLDELSRSLPYVDFFIPSLREAMILTGSNDPAEQVKILRAAGAPHVVGVKLGAKGCILSDGRRTVRMPAQPVKEVVDTTGAGDSFLAGIITAYLHGMDLEQMARFANAVGCCCVQAMGASTGIRSFRETMRLLR